MSYQINKTDGTLLATVADGQVDDLTTDITLIGKNYSGFGESLNENFIKLLENFASTSRPENPIRGQIWFDAGEAKLKVYTGTGFVPVSSASISNSQPAQQVLAIYGLTTSVNNYISMMVLDLFYLALPTLKHRDLVDLKLKLF